MNSSVNLPSVNELSQMFPKLDGDLGSVANHFRFDHLVAPENPCESIDSSEVKTPLQNPAQFPGEEQAADEEDDEPTISTDCLTSQMDSNPCTHETSEGIVSTATKLLEDIINKSAPKQQVEPFTNISKHTLTSSTNAEVRKPLSFHGSESTSSVSSLKKTAPDAMHRFPRRNLEYSRFMSVDQRSISDTEDNVANEYGSIKRKNSAKTQSCANIKLSCAAPRLPGALLVKEKYIELPKQVAHRTNSSGRDQAETTDDAASMESVVRMPKNGPNKLRFTTTKVDESQLGVSVLKEV